MELILKSEDQEVKLTMPEGVKIEEVIASLKSANLILDHIGSRPNDRG